MIIAEMVGKAVLVKFEGIFVLCRVVSDETAYGHPRVRVAPVGGGGEQVVDISRLARAATRSRQ